MMRAMWSAALIAAVGMLGACGTNARNGGVGDGPTGNVRVEMNGLVAANSLASIEVQNVFDPSQVYLQDCQEKPHTLNGEPFCDELLVLPPGIYEVIAQPQDPNCRPEQDHYKVVVKPGETTEIQINLVCGTSNGGLDVIVQETEVPVVTNVAFTFANGERANKFVCQDNGNVTATVSVTDSDTDCATLFQHYSWQVKGPNDTTFTNTLTPPIVPGSETTSIGPGGVCNFSVTLDAASALGDYQLRLNVSDTVHQASFAFPIHLIDCGICSGDLSGAGPFHIGFDITLPATDCGRYAVLNQRDVCGLTDFWDVRLLGGFLVVESAGPGGSNYSVIFSNVALNDGQPHTVSIDRDAAGLVTITIDGVPDGSGQALATFGQLPPLAIGTDVCEGVDGTLAFPADASLTDICVDRR